MRGQAGPVGGGLQGPRPPQPRPALHEDALRPRGGRWEALGPAGGSRRGVRGPGSSGAGANARRAPHPALPIPPPHPHPVSVSSPFLPPPGGHRAPSAPSQPRQPGCRPPLPAASLSLFLEVAGALPSTLRPRHHGQRGAGGGGGAGPALGRVADPPGIRLGSRLAAVAIETEQQRDEGRATGWGRGPLGEPGGWAGRGGGGPAVGASVCLTRGTPFRTQAPPTRTPPNRGGRALPAPPRPAAPTLS